MKVSLNWVSKYTKIDTPIDELIEKIGAQLGAIDEIISLGPRYEGILAAKVISSEKHPNADKLKVCLIDDGKKAKKVTRDSNGYVQVVCGAPNVEAGQLVAWLPPGTTVPSSFDKDPFVLDAREIRGVISNGMIGSSKELAIGDDHEGILVIDEEAKPGDDFADIYELDDLIIDIENKMFTHRPDCFGILGVAREIAGIQGKPFKSPDWYVEKPVLPKAKGETLPFRINNTLPKLVPRFCAVVVSDIKVTKSPIALQSLLSRLGIRPINKMVDLTNFYMLATGQPLHAYDYDKVAKIAGGKAGLETRLSKAGETLKLLGGKQVKLQAGAILITAGDKPVGLGGVMGGAETEVDEHTKTIIIESANFDMNLTRKTAFNYGLFTDAATRFTKGQSPRQNLAVIAQIAANIENLFGGRLASDFVDDYHMAGKPVEINVSKDFINSRLGLELTAAQIAKLLENVEFKVLANQDKLHIAAPFWRTDIEIPEDVVEEAGRLYGYDHMPRVLPKKDLSAAPLDPLLDFKTRLRQILAEAGASETLTYSFVHGSLLSNAGQDTKDAYHIRNAISPDLQYYRLSLAPSLLEKVHPNIKAGYDEFALYEIGKAHVKGLLNKENLPDEFERLAIVVATAKKDKAGAAYYGAKDYCNFLLEYKLGLGCVRYVPLGAGLLSKDWKITAAAFDPDRTSAIYQKDDFLGLVGEPSAKMRAALKLPAKTALVELDVLMLQRQAPDKSAYYPLLKYPSLDQDICLRSDIGTSYARLEEVISQYLDSVSRQKGYVIELKPLDIFQREGDQKHKQTTWRITLAHPDRTLTTEESNLLLDGLAEKAKQELKTERI